MKTLFLLFLGLAVARADKIVGGTDAHGPIPYQVRIQYATGSIRCGASLVHENWVMTAAHCQGSAVDWRTWMLAFGYYDGTNNGIQYFPIADQLPNLAYDSATLDNDIMMLKIDGTVLMTSTVHVGKLPGQYAGIDQPAVGSPCIVSGWGTTESGGTVSPYLQEVEVFVVSNEACNEPYGTITTGMVCMSDDGEDSCQGDSGGPAKCGDTIQGIVSWGIGCAFPRFPGVYARVAVYRDWITEVTGGEV